MSDYITPRSHPQVKPLRLYNKENTLCGVITSEWQFNDVRVQIHQQRATGYYITDHNGENPVPIDRNGQLKEYPEYVEQMLLSTDQHFTLLDIKSDNP